MFRLLPGLLLVRTAVKAPCRQIISPTPVIRQRLCHINYGLAPMNHFSYRTESAKLPAGWSCNWESWEFNSMSLYQDDLEEFWELTALIEPLAFDVLSAHFVFHAGGEYYFHFPHDAKTEDTMTKRFTGKFASHDDFLERFKGELDHGRWVELELSPSARRFLRLDDHEDDD
ncbi:hypothetical protein FB45DRAFT_873404 [Roridomyces roridus]|uniref:Uncharacterized protein n=1 Tax=Roridomyces roridus TaxID=1738132 RepID=A0AAD7BBU2_9AGAR|nr:hypothetical protein FB45DRAFT_873404 [Roridomyces roridus]